MPEGPEVKIMTQGLQKNLQGKTLNAIVILGGRYLKKSPDNFLEFNKLLPTKILEIGCKGKFIWFKFKDDWTMWCTLGMTGGWKINKEKHSHIEFNITHQTDKDIQVSNYETFSIWFTDMRNFGTIKFSNSQKEFQKKLKSIGPDILSDDSFTVEQFIKIIRKHNKHSLPKVLMNQCIVSGIGNYLKAEALYDAKISPHRKLEDITDEELTSLFTSIRTIITNSFKARGATIKNYSDINNNKGQYIFEFQVYNQKKDKNGYKVIKELTNDKRQTHWVKEVQV